jgi:hypothetical protein
MLSRDAPTNFTTVATRRHRNFERTLHQRDPAYRSPWWQSTIGLPTPRPLQPRCAHSIASTKQALTAGRAGCPLHSHSSPASATSAKPRPPGSEPPGAAGEHCCHLFYTPTTVGTGARFYWRDRKPPFIRLSPTSPRWISVQSTHILQPLRPVRTVFQLHDPPDAITTTFNTILQSPASGYHQDSAKVNTKANDGRHVAYSTRMRIYQHRN